MRILVMSDSHGSRRAVETVLERHDDIKNVFFLGDGVGDIDSVKKFFGDKNYYTVRGNCDWNSEYPVFGEAVIEGVRIIFTHGHKLDVKYGTEKLFETAVNYRATVALYGHTHIADSHYRDGIYLINPGALHGSRNGADGYAVIDITKQGIMPSLMKI